MSDAASSVEPVARPPIAGLRLMAVLRWLLVIGSAAVAGLTWWTVGAGHEQHEGAAHYYCPMHPEITSPTPGTCPICFMTLEPIERAEDGEAMHESAEAPRPETTPVMLTLGRRQTAGIVTELVAARAISGELRLNASVEAREGARAEVRARAAGFVERALVRESGARVRRGQTLAWIYAPEILRAEEELLVAHRWAGAPSDTSAAETAAHERLALLGVGEADIARVLASGQAERTVALRAPIDGHVISVTAVRGARVDPDTLLYEIADLETVRVIATTSLDVQHAAATGTASFLPRGSTTPIPLTLELVEPHADHETGLARLRFLATTPDHTLSPGTLGIVVVAGAAHDEMLVARDAVIDTGRHRYVFVEHEDGVFEARDVELGPLDGEDRVITSGLAAGERVVVRGAFVLDSESRLRAALGPAHASAEPSMPGMPMPEENR